MLCRSVLTTEHNMDIIERNKCNEIAYNSAHRAAQHLQTYTSTNSHRPGLLIMTQGNGVTVVPD